MWLAFLGGKGGGGGGRADARGAPVREASDRDDAIRGVNCLMVVGAADC